MFNKCRDKKDTKKQSYWGRCCFSECFLVSPVLRSEKSCNVSWFNNCLIADWNNTTTTLHGRLDTGNQCIRFAAFLVTNMSRSGPFIQRKHWTRTSLYVTLSWRFFHLPKFNGFPVIAFVCKIENCFLKPLELESCCAEKSWSTFPLS